MAASPCRDTIDELKRSKQNRSFAELKAILEANGFTMHRRQRGSHRVFTKPGCEIAPSIPEKRGSLLVAYVRKVVQALEECCED